MNLWQPYLIAIVVGLLVGIEREKAHPEEKVMGVRTFLLISILGSVAAGLDNLWIASLITAFVFGLILISYFNQSREKEASVDRGLTTEIAASIVYCLGYVAHSNPAMAALLGPIVAVILFSKSTLHRFTSSLKPSELEAALFLILGGVLVVNIVPDEVVDSWGIFNPRKFGFLVLTLAAIEFSSYIMAKIIGEERGSLVVGFLGGFVSSTAVLLSSARQSKDSKELWRPLFCAALAAKLAAFLQLFFILGMISPPLLMRVAFPVGSGMVLGALVLYLVARKKNAASSVLTLKSPLDWQGVFRLAILLGGILGAISFAKLWFGNGATGAVSFFTGLFELHGVSLANATMFTQGQLAADAATVNILLAVVSSLLAKIAMSLTISRGPFSRYLSLVFAAMIGVTVAVWFGF